MSSQAQPAGVQDHFTGSETIDTVVIGGGQAGLTVGYLLKQQGRQFVILDAHERVGDAWRKRWDSLRLFSPARFDGLVGMPFPAKRDAFLTKDEMADYLERYAARFNLPVRTGVRVDRLAQGPNGLEVYAGDHRYDASNVVVAMSSQQAPWVPPFARDLDPRITQLHSKDYRNASQLLQGPVLVVGVGNSGADIGMDVVKTHPTWLAGKESFAIPFRIEKFVARHFLTSIVRFVGHRVLTVRTPIGRKARPKIITQAAPLIRVKPKDLTEAGVRRVPRITGVRDGLPVTADNEVLNVANVIWCTGFRPGFSWIDLPILGDRQEPAHVEGIVPDVPGLYFVGLHFLFSMSSETIGGVQRDAERIVKHLARRTPKGSSAEPSRPRVLDRTLAR